MQHIAGTLIPDTQVATILGVSVASLRRWRAERRGPKFVRVEGQIRYRLRDLHDYLTARTEPQGVTGPQSEEPATLIGGTR